MNKKLTYSSSGVSIQRGDDLAHFIGKKAKRTQNKDVLAGIGGFGALSRIPKGLKNPIMVTSTDGVGTKLLLAIEAQKYGTVGIDLVAMSVNDVLTLGAKPSIFLDYFATGHLDLNQARNILSGVVKGCHMAQCALVGGETAEMPGMYEGDDFDLAGFCVGFVDQKKIVDGSKMKAGHVLIGLPSSGLHSNGFSLVRKIIKTKKLKLNQKYKGFKQPLIDELLKPTRIYVSNVLSILKKTRVYAMAHITGGGLEGNLERVLPKGLGLSINVHLWKIPYLFTFLQDKGDIDEKDMFETFNMGIGFCLVIAKQDFHQVKKIAPDAKIIGHVIKDAKSKVKLVGSEKVPSASLSSTKSSSMD